VRRQRSLAKGLLWLARFPQVLVPAVAAPALSALEQWEPLSTVLGCGSTQHVSSPMSPQV